MQRAQWSRPSCLVMIVLFALLLGAIAWLASGDPLRTPNPQQVTRETTTYDKDIPSGQRPGSGR